MNRQLPANTPLKPNRACKTIQYTHKLRPHPLAYLVMNMEDIAGFDGELLHCARNIGEVGSYVRSISQWVVLVLRHI